MKLDLPRGTELLNALDSLREKHHADAMKCPYNSDGKEYHYGLRDGIIEAQRLLENHLKEIVINEA